MSGFSSGEACMIELNAAEAEACYYAQTKLQALAA